MDQPLIAKTLDHVELMLEAGWIKHTSQSSKGHCLTAMVNIASAKVGVDIPKRAAISNEIYRRMAKDNILRGRTFGEWSEYCLRNGFLPQNPTMVIWFNDHPDTTKKDIEQLIERIRHGVPQHQEQVP